MAETKTLYFIRHGQTEWNAIRRMQGQMNSDLSKLGRAQANAAGELLEQFGIEALYASPLDRTRQTAAIINRRLELPVTFDDRIMEWDCGDWSGHLYAEVAEQWHDEWAAYQADKFHYRGPGCENYPDMFGRARPFLEEMLTTPAKVIGIVSHGMIGKVMLAIMMELGEAETLAIHQPNDVIMRVDVTPDKPARASHYVRGQGPFEGLHTEGDQVVA